VNGADDWDRPVVRRLYLATKRAQELLGRAMAEEGATVATWGALDALDCWHTPGGISQAELASAVRVEQATMTVQVRKMLQDGLCERVPDSVDRRVRRITITTRGRELLMRLRARAAEVERDILTPLSGHQRHELATLLRLLAAELPRP
jgi:DNA-binding MarR family transcriptional regulator